MIKFRAEERHRMKKVEEIVGTGVITLGEREQLETGDYGEPEKKKPKSVKHEPVEAQLDFTPIGMWL